MKSGRRRSSIVNIHKGSLSESYFTVRGAALILPQGERPRKSKKSHGGDIQHHLQSMLYLLRHEDRIKVAVKLETSGKDGHQRYMALVSTVGRQDTEEAVILGIDLVKDTATIGLVLPVYNGNRIRLDGDGGFSVGISAEDRKYLFKPVSVQAMWSALQSLQKAVRMAEVETYLPNGLTHTWVQYYTAQVDKSQPEFITMWNAMEGVDVYLSHLVTGTSDEDEKKEMKAKISRSLTEVMMKADLDEATSRSLREAVENSLGHSVKSFRRYFDSEMMRILGQMDAPSQILDFLYLGTEWNASNIDELTENGVTYILNVTREIDNFFPGQLKYMNIRLYDVEEAQLLPYWDKTYRFISKARSSGSKVLVHCKRGISRSASTVIAYLMKENQWTLDQSLKYVHDLRSVVCPNDGFMEQLRTYEGILNASNKRYIFKSKSTEELLQPYDEDIPFEGGFLEGEDVYRHLFDYPPAYEEQVLQTLGQGQQDNMVQMDPDLETGSRSTDSLEDCYPDDRSQSPGQQDDLTRAQPTKGQYSFTTQYGDAIVTSGEVAGLELIGKAYASEPEEEVLNMTYSCAGTLNGSGSTSFSVSSGDVALVSTKTRADECGYEQLVKPSSWSRRHKPGIQSEVLPQVVVEMVSQEQVSMPSSRRPEPTGFQEDPPPGLEEVDRQGVVTQQSNVQENISETMTSDVKSSDVKCPEIENQISPQLQIALESRLRPDDSWIKLDTEEKMESATESGAAEDDLPLGTSPPTFIIGDEFPSVSPPVASEDVEMHAPMLSAVKSSEASSSRVRSASLGDGKHGIGSTKSESSLNKLAIRNRTASLTSQQSEQLQPEVESEPQPEGGDSEAVDYLAQFGIVQYYTKDQIPWCPGTVKKMKSDFSKSLSNSDDDSDSGPKFSKPAEQPMVVSAEEVPKGDNSERLTQSCIELHPSTDEPNLMAEMQENRPKSVYEAEDIQLPEGMVRKFKDKLEGNRSEEGEEEDSTLESKPIQRSASLKEKGETPKSKRPERRKTCSPILSPASSSPPREDNNVSNVNIVPDSQSDPAVGDVEDVAPMEMDTPPQECPSVDSLDSNLTLFICGSEQVPLEKGIVKKHKQDFESRRDSESRSCEVPDPAPAKDCASTDAEPSEDVAAASTTADTAILSASQSDNTEEPDSLVVSERLIGTVREQTSILEGKDQSKEADLVSVSPVSKRSKKDDKSSIDPQTLARMRELGCEHLNQSKCDGGDDNDVADLTVVKQVVRSIEKDTKCRKPERKITIIETKGCSQPLCEKSRSMDDGRGTEGAKRTRQWVKDSGAFSLEGDDRANRDGLTLPLDHDGGEGKTEMLSHGSIGSISPRSDSEPSRVRHLVGRFENDDGTSSNRSSLSVADMGLCFVDTKKKKEENISDVEPRVKSSTSSSCALRPKSADHISKHDPRAKGQGDGHTELPSVTDDVKGDNRPAEDVRKVRRAHGLVNPVSQRLGASPFYNTM